MLWGGVLGGGGEVLGWREAAVSCRCAALCARCGIQSAAVQVLLGRRIHCVILAAVDRVIHRRLCAAVHCPEPAEPDGSASILHPAAVAVPDGAGGAAGAPPEPPPPGAQRVCAEKS